MTGPRSDPIDAKAAEKRQLDQHWRRGWRRPFRVRTRWMSPSRRPRKRTITSSART